MGAFVVAKYEMNARGDVHDPFEIRCRAIFECVGHNAVWKISLVRRKDKVILRSTTRN